MAIGIDLLTQCGSASAVPVPDKGGWQVRDPPPGENDTQEHIEVLAATALAPDTKQRVEAPQLDDRITPDAEVGACSEDPRCVGIKPCGTEAEVITMWLKGL